MRFASWRAVRKFSLLVASIALLATVRPVHAQFLDPDNHITCWSCFGHRYHFAAGAAIDLAMRPAPFFAKSWRGRVLGRLGTVAALGSLYELNNYFGICAPPQNNWPCGVSGRGFSLLGLFYDVAGAASIEALFAGLKKAIR